MPEFKYVMFEVTQMGDLVRRIPVLFPSHLIHKEVSDRICRAINDSMNSFDARPVSAGTVHFEVDGIGGDSETLGLKSDKLDETILRTYDYVHGLVK